MAFKMKGFSAGKGTGSALPKNQKSSPLTDPTKNL